MLAVRLHHGGLQVEEIETPAPHPGELLVRVCMRQRSHATSSGGR